MSPSGVQPSPVETRADEHAPEGMQESAGAHELPVLVVEDNAVVRAMMTAVLVDAGYPVMAASDGVVALERVRTVRPRLIVLDLQLPHLSGDDFLAAYRAGGGRAPVVLCTAAGDAAGRAEHLAAAACLPKPFIVEELLDTVASLAPL
jgi:two-component system chemotaxis response regulator CheY